MEVYIIDNQNVFTKSETIDPMEALPKGSVMVAPPTLVNGQFARWNSGVWEVLDAYPLIPPEPIHIPSEIRMAQCRAQLIIDGKDDDVELLLNGIADPIQQKLYRSFWEYETMVKRDNAMINEMAPALSIDLDAFFINASKL